MLIGPASSEPGHSRELFQRNASCLAALVFVLCEHTRFLEEEIHYIWKQPLTRVNVIYLFARYLAIGSLFTNCILMFIGPLAAVPVTPEHCRAWFSLSTVVSCLVLFVVDAVSMLRVYALYHCDPRIGAFFAALLLTEAAFVTSCSSTTLGLVPFDPICDVAETPKMVVLFASSVIITQTSLLLFTSHKRKLMAGQLLIPLAKLVLREGTWVSALICCIFFFTVTYSLITGTSKPHIVLIWPTALLSVAACRIILSLHGIAAVGRSVRSCTSDGTDTDIQFTSLFLAESTCDEGFVERRYSIGDNQAKGPQKCEQLGRRSINGSSPRPLSLRLDSG